jgi:SWI/SNF-related matrix-associated actin-dependent regulator of chromatin subfamily A-like protein 1
VSLYPFQQAAIDRLAQSTAPLPYLAYDMGLGKTRIALLTAKKRGVKRLLVICPAVGRLSWLSETHRVWPNGPPLVIVRSPRDVLRLKSEECIGVVSYGLISNSNGSYNYVNELAKLPAFDMTVLDEAHALKNVAAIRTKGILHHLRLAKVLCDVLPMSGTPAPNHAGELFPILRTVYPMAIKRDVGKTMSKQEFEDVFCDVKEKWFNGRAVRVIEGSKNLGDLRARLDPYMLRLRKKDALPELPDMSFDVLPVEIDADIGQEFDDVMPGPEASDEEILKALTPAGGAHIARLRQALGLAKAKGAIEAISDKLESCRRKMLVFAHHRSVLDEIEQGLALYRPVRLDGSTSEPDRKRAINAFLTDPNVRVFIGQTTAAGTSITLVNEKIEVSDVFFVEASTNPGDNNQAASRIHRIGQKNPVQVWFITAFDTFDERIQDLIQRRTAEFHKLFS